MFSKRLIFVFVLSVAVLFCAAGNLFADDVSSGATLRWSYLVRRVVAEHVSPFFATPDREKTDVVNMDIAAGLSLAEAQVFLGVNTNRVGTYNLALTFFPMHNKDDAQDTTVYSYMAKVYSSPDSNAVEMRELDVNTTEGVRFEFSGRTAYSADYPTQFFYPIAFSFGNYEELFADGTYEGSITIEVVIGT